MTPDRSNSLLWNGTVRKLSLADQLLVAQKSGFGKLSITPWQVARWQEGGFSVADMRAMAEDRGVKLAQLDPLARWAPKWRPEGVDPQSLSFINTGTDDFFRIAGAFRVEAMTTICTAPSGSVNRNQLTDAFASICRRADDQGLRCDLEFIPMYCVSDLNMAWQIVRDGGMKNSGIVFDYWHFMRGNPDFELLGAIPGDRISAVQLSDALMIVPDGRNASDDGLNFRLPCGEGEFPIDRITRTLDRIDALHNVGPEIFSVRFDSLSADEIVTEIGKFFPAMLDRARNPASAIAAQQQASSIR